MDDKIEKFEWKTRWTSVKSTWEPETSFIDNDGTVNDIYANYERYTQERRKRNISSRKRKEIPTVVHEGLRPYRRKSCPTWLNYVHNKIN